jgi:hypothetical protein
MIANIDSIPAIQYVRSLGRRPAIGFTGTRKGLTERQVHLLADVLEHIKPARVDHGGCTGGDGQCHLLLKQFPIEEVHIWYSNLPHTWMKEPEKGRITLLIKHAPAPPLDRNWKIILDKDLLIACPAESVMQLRSGTWSTIRYAEQLDVRTLVIFPYEDQESPYARKD